MRILVTGGLGYVGGRVASHLACSNVVYVATRAPDRLRPAWLASGELVATHQLGSPDTLEQLGIEAIVHLGTASDTVCNAHPELGLRTNGAETGHLIERAVAAGVRRFIYFSTVHVYGAPLVGELDESTTVHPSNPYTLAHRAGENATLAHRAKGDIETIVVRLANAFGPPALPEAGRWNLLANDLCRQAVEHRKLVLNTPGYQLRNFIALTDVGQAVDLLLQHPDDRCSNGIFNLAGNMAVRVLDFTELIAERTQRVLGFRPAIVRPTTPVVESPPLHLSTVKLARIGFAHRTSLVDEIDRTLDYCRTRFGIPAEKSSSAAAEPV